MTFPLTYYCIDTMCHILSLAPKVTLTNKTCVHLFQAFATDM